MDNSLQHALAIVRRAGAVGINELLKMFPVFRHGSIDRRGITFDEEWTQRLRLEQRDEWERWSKEIPAIVFPEGWGVRIIPPRTGAIVRFHVDGVSVYLDCYDKLGCFGSPYWEVYPYEGDIGRCEMGDVETLLKMIGSARG